MPDFSVPSLTLRRGGVALVPLSLEHEADLEAAAADGELWRLPFTSVPGPGEALGYIEAAIEARQTGSRVPFAVVDEDSGSAIGSTSYHDIVPEARRVEIGYTWYARRFQRTHVNTLCKLMLLEHAFDNLGCNVVGWRTDGENYISQAAIEALGARFDGRLRRFGARKGTIRDRVFYSMLPDEWPASRERLFARIERYSVE